VTQTLAVWGEQLSVVLLDERLVQQEDATLVSLRETPLATARLKAVLGRRCSDVRIWTFREDIESDEAKQAAVSYVLDDEELFYGIYVHGTGDNDTLIFRDEIITNLVESCFSLGEGRPLPVS